MEKSISKAKSLRSLFDSLPKEDRQNLMSKGSIYPIALHLFKEDPAFYARDYSTARVAAKIREYADAMKRGDVFPALQVKVVDGNVMVRCGVLTLRAALLASSEGFSINRLAALDVDGDEIVQDKAILKSDDGLSLLPLERAGIYARMMLVRRMTMEQIAIIDGCTVATVKNYISAYNLPLEMKELVNDGSISMTLATELFSKHGTGSVSMVKQKLQDVASLLPQTEMSLPGVQDVSSSNVRVTRKSFAGSGGSRSVVNGLVKQLAHSIRSFLPTLEKAEVKDDDTVLVPMSKDLYEQFKRLAEEVGPELKVVETASEAGLTKAA